MELGSRRAMGPVDALLARMPFFSRRSRATKDVAVLPPPPADGMQAPLSTPTPAAATRTVFSAEAPVTSSKLPTPIEEPTPEPSTRDILKRGLSRSCANIKVAASYSPSDAPPPCPPVKVSLPRGHVGSFRYDMDYVMNGANATTEKYRELGASTPSEYKRALRKKESQLSLISQTPSLSGAYDAGATGGQSGPDDDYFFSLQRKASLTLIRERQAIDAKLAHLRSGVNIPADIHMLNGRRSDSCLRQHSRSQPRSRAPVVPLPSIPRPLTIYVEEDDDEDFGTELEEPTTRGGKEADQIIFSLRPINAECPTPVQSPLHGTFEQSGSLTAEDYDVFQFAPDAGANDSQLVGRSGEVFSENLGNERRGSIESTGTNGTTDSAGTFSDESETDDEYTIPRESSESDDGVTLHDHSDPPTAAPFHESPEQILRRLKEQEKKLRDQRARVVAGMMIERKRQPRPRRYASTGAFGHSAQMPKEVRVPLHRLSRNNTMRSNYRPKAIPRAGSGLSSSVVEHF